MQRRSRGEMQREAEVGGEKGVGKGRVRKQQLDKKLSMRYYEKELPVNLFLPMEIRYIYGKSDSMACSYSMVIISTQKPLPTSFWLL